MLKCILTQFVNGGYDNMNTLYEIKSNRMSYACLGDNNIGLSIIGPPELHKMKHLEPLLLTWFNFNPSMDK